MKKAAILFLAIFMLFALLLSACGDGLGGGGGSNKTERPEKDKYAPSKDDYIENYNFSTNKYIRFKTNGIEVGGATVKGKTVVVSAAGDYIVSGESDDASIVVDASDKKVRLVLNGLSLTSKTSAAVYIKKAAKVTITLNEGTENSLSDSSATVVDGNGEPTAAVFSKSDLVLNGSGKLTVNGNYNNALQSKDALYILKTNLTVSSVDDGIIGKELAYIENSNITLESDGDGIRSTDEAGIILIDGGSFELNSASDAIESVANIIILGGDFQISTQGGKGIKAGARLSIDGGSFDIDSVDDAIHSDASSDINGGQFNLSSGDDGIQSDGVLLITAGDILISKSSDGLKTSDLSISGGEINITATDDGINIGGDVDSSDGQLASEHKALISGGNIYVCAVGNGLDSDGNITMSGGTIIIDGSENTKAIKYEGIFNITGGSLLALGASEAAQNPTSSVIFGFCATTYSVNSGVLKITDKGGNTLVEHTAKNRFNSVIYFSAAVTKDTYNILVDGQSKESITVSDYITVES